MEDKEIIIDEFLKMITSSWTWERMTSQEQENFIEILSKPINVKNVRGTKKQKWETLNAFYSFYLSGLGYRNFNWRENQVIIHASCLF